MNADGWTRVTLITFRFAFVYLALYSIVTQILGGLLLMPGLAVPPLGTVWPRAFMGASTPYQVFTGCAEMLAGLLLLAPHTTLLGAAIALVDMIQVFVLNMTYDFGLKQFSCHLILLALFLMTPGLPRLRDVLLANREAAASPERALFTTDRANRRAVVAQLAFGVYLIGMFTSLNLRYWHADGGGAGPRSPLSGIWNVEELTIDGRSRPVSENDYNRRWRRAIFDLPDVVVFQRTDGSFAHYGAAIDSPRRALRLTRRNSRTWRASFSFDRPAPDRLVLAGTMDGSQIAMRLRLVGLDTFRLRNSTFRWIRPPDPFAG